MIDNNKIKMIINEEIASTPYQNVMIDIGNFASDNAIELGKKYAREIHDKGKIDIFKFISQQYYSKNKISPEAFE
jgi:hypothetical protein